MYRKKITRSRSVFTVVSHCGPIKRRMLEYNGDISIFVRISSYEKKVRAYQAVLVSCIKLTCKTKKALEKDTEVIFLRKGKFTPLLWTKKGPERAIFMTRFLPGLTNRPL